MLTQGKFLKRIKFKVHKYLQLYPHHYNLFIYLFLTRVILTLVEWLFSQK